MPERAVEVTQGGRSPAPPTLPLLRLWLQEAAAQLESGQCQTSGFDLRFFIFQGRGGRTGADEPFLCQAGSQSELAEVTLRLRKSGIQKEEGEVEVGGGGLKVCPHAGWCIRLWGLVSRPIRRLERPK